MSMNPWAMPQKRLELPPTQFLLQADETQIETLESAQRESQVEFTVEPNDEEDYAVFSRDTDGEMIATRVSHCLTINGVRWHIVPGKNKVPKSVYEFFLQCADEATKKRILPGQNYLGPLSQHV